jgi:hypothetical protein
MREPRFHSAFTRFELAKVCAEMLERMTGDKCTVETKGHTEHYILRDTGTKWVQG